VERMSILGWARDCWKPRRFYRDIHSRGSMHTKVMRSVSSEDIRSEARRAIRTREGKDCHRIRPFGSAPLSADHGVSGAGGYIPFGVCFRRPDNGYAILP
jgi:hypothetical protein